MLPRDSRALKKPVLQYSESHNDDVTVVISTTQVQLSRGALLMSELQVQLHPNSSQGLLSGSTDGLVNIYDSNQTDEDEALVQVTNHGSSINHARFLSDSQFFALSHDENFSIYHLEDQNIDTDDLQPTAFGDLRPRLECEYVVDVVPLNSEGEAVVGAGSHGKQQLDLVPFRHVGTSWEFDLGNTIRLPGAHGEEVVRSMFLDHDANAIFTAGEDGNIKAWRTNTDLKGNGMQMEGREIEKPRKKKKKGSTDNVDGNVRFRPY